MTSVNHEWHWMQLQFTETYVYSRGSFGSAWLYWDERTYSLSPFVEDEPEPLPDEITTVKEAKQFLSILIRMGVQSTNTA
jgi:hypothetical protein